MPLHPAIVHIPLGIAMVLPVIALGLFFLINRKWIPHKSWAFVIVLQTLIIGSAYVAMETGENEEDIVEKVVQKSEIHEHEENAELFFYLSLALLILSVPGMVKSDSIRNTSQLIFLAASLGILLMVYKTGHSGGELIFKHKAYEAYQKIETESKSLKDTVLKKKDSSEKKEEEKTKDDDD